MGTGLVLSLSQVHHLRVLQRSTCPSEVHESQCRLHSDVHKASKHHTAPQIGGCGNNLVCLQSLPMLRSKSFLEANEVEGKGPL